MVTGIQKKNLRSASAHCVPVIGISSPADSFFELVLKSRKVGFPLTGVLVSHLAKIPCIRSSALSRDTLSLARRERSQGDAKRIHCQTLDAADGSPQFLMDEAES